MMVFLTLLRKITSLIGRNYYQRITKKLKLFTKMLFCRRNGKMLKKKRKLWHWKI